MNDKEAIERLNRFKTIKVMYGNTFAMHLEQLKQLQQDLETVLNITENQKAEIEKKDKIIDLMSEEIAFNYDINSYADVITIKKQLKEKYEKKAEEEK